MPNVRLRLSNGEPLFIPAHAFRFLESAGSQLRESVPEAEAVLLYDLGGQDGLQTVYLKTKGVAVAEQVQADPKFRDRLLEFETALDTTIWTLPDFVNGVAGHKPPSDDDIAEIEALTAEIETAMAELGDDASEAAMQARIAHAQALAGLAGRKSFKGVRARLDLLIPDRKAMREPDSSAPAGMHFTYWLRCSADDVLDAVDPAPTTKPKSPVQATPVREPPRRRKAAARG